MYYNDRNSPDYTYMYSLKGPIHTVIITVYMIERDNVNMYCAVF